MMSATALSSTQPARRYAVVFTTYGWDDLVSAQYQRNATRVRSGDLYVMVDESRGPIQIPPSIRKVTASQTIAADLGLRIAYHRALFWHNIDYLYYVFFDKHPDYEYYVFLDYDAVVDADFDALIDEIGRRQIDLVGSPVDCDLDDYVFAPQHAATYDASVFDAWISAVTVLSHRAVSRLFDRRKEMSAAPTEEQQRFWPFCEVFVPSELNRAGFKSAELSDFGDVKNFAWWPPTLVERLTTSRAPAPIFVHPVLDRPRYIGSMLRHSRTVDFLRPNSRLWRAVWSLRDRRWIRPFIAEAIHRVMRVLGVGQNKDVSTIVVGMRWGSR